MEHFSSSASVSGGSSSPQQQQEVILQCDDLLDLIAKTTKKTNNQEYYDDPFGHPPPPKIASVLKLSSTVTTAFPKNQNNNPAIIIQQPTTEETTTTTHYYLVIGYSSHCVGAQVFVLQQQSSEEQHNNNNHVVWDASRPRIVLEEEADVRHVGVVVRSRNEPQNRHVLHPKTKNIRKTVSWTQNRVQIIVAANSNSSSSQLLCAVEMTLGWNGFGVDPVCPVATPSGLGDVLEIVVQDDTVALSYSNGTIVQLPASALTYNKVTKKDNNDDDSDDDGELLLDNTKTTILWDSNIVKVQVQLPPSAANNVEGGGGDCEYHILPLLLKNSNNNNAAAAVMVAPCTHISDTIRSTLEACTLQSAHTLNNDEVTKNNKSRRSSRISAALVYPTEKPEALGDNPTLAVYTTTNTTTSSSSTTAGPNNPNNDGSSDDNNDHDNAAEDARDSELLSVAMGATSTLFRSVSSVLGFRSSTTSKSASSLTLPNEKKFKAANNNKTTNNNNILLSSPQQPRQLLGPLYQPPSALLTSSGMEYHDSPRRLVSVKCSNNNNMILATDSLGRVLVWDTVPTFSVRTIFKGWREAQVIFFSDTSGGSGSNHFLALYSPVRKSLQVWNCDTCTTVTTRSNIPHHPQIQLVSSSDERCFLLQPLNSSKGVKFILKEIVPSLELSTSIIPGGVSSSSSSLKSMMTTSPLLQSPSSSRNNNNNHNHIQLQLLQQILSSQENPLDQVLEIVSSIENPHEFLTVIPLVASSSTGGNNNDVKLLQMVLNHAQQLLRTDVVDEKQEDNNDNNNNDELQSCLHYHQQLIQVYQTILDFEVHQKEKHLLFDEEEGDERAQPKSTWAMEGLSWMATHAQVMASSSSQKSSSLPSDTVVLSFSQLCQACELQTNKKNNKKKKNCTIVFKDSYRTRRPLLQHLFRPLLHDTFSYVTLTNALEEMGLLNDDDDDSKNEDALLESYFSEWYLHCHTGRVSNLARVSLLRVNSNIARWLKARVAASVDARLEKEHVGKDTVLLSTVYHDWIQNCEPQHLTEAFLLAATCRDAISGVCQKREVRTYGRVYNQNVLQPWETLLKRLRLLMFVQLRLYTTTSDENNDAFRLEAPLSLQNCEKELNWNRIVAQDELRASAVHEELVALEQQCSNNDNNNSNDNATTDVVAVWRHMQQACTISEEERAEYLVELELTQTILGYVPHYYQDSAVLCAHRTMLLFQKFKQYPQRLDLLQQALSHCRALSTLSGGDYALSVRYAMWQTMLRPLFQEYLFGEQQQQQHNPDNEDDDEEDQQSNNSWIQTVGKAALIVLNLMEQSMNDDADNNNQKKDDAANKKRLSDTATNNNNDDNNNWPPFQPDQTLQLLSQKLRQVQLHGDAFDFHRILILGCMQSPKDGFSTLANAVGPEVFSQAFQPNSLCGMLSIPIAPVKTQVEAQMEFIQTAIAKRARSISTNSTHLDRIDGDELEDLETLALLWSVDTRDVRTLFVLALYELGKDELFNSHNIILLQQQLLDVERLVDDGIVIICQRLTHAVLDPRVNPPIRNVLSQLDADLVEWIRAQGSSSSTENTTTIQLKQHIPPLSYTHSFLLQLLRLSTCSETKQSLHSLSVLTGIILNELGNTV